MENNYELHEEYLSLNDFIQADNYEEALKSTEKILKISPEEKEAQHCKIISLINLNRYNECITFIKEESLLNEYIIEFSYSLIENKDYKASLDYLNNIDTKNLPKELHEQILLCKAQSHYKLSEYEESFTLLDNIIEIKSKIEGYISNNEDILTNYLAVYLLSKKNSDITHILKNISTWESYFNYALIQLSKGKFNESLDTLIKMEELKGDDSYNKTKLKLLNFSIIQTIFEGFDFYKTTNLQEEYNNLLQKNSFKNMQPYFYNNYLHSKKEKENLNNTLKKLDAYSKHEILTSDESIIIQLNKVILLLRSNKFNEASKEFKLISLKDNERFCYDIRYILVYCYLVIKCDKNESLDNIINSKESYKQIPEVQLILLQTMLNNLTLKTTDKFHYKLMQFVSENYSYCCNYQFINFFINFYETRHLKSYLREFIESFSDISKLNNNIIIDKNNSEEVTKLNKKKLYMLLGKTLYKCYLFEKAGNFFKYVIENIDEYNNECIYWYISCSAHNIDNDSNSNNKTDLDTLQSKIDTLNIDGNEGKSNELISDIFSRFKKEKNKPILSKEKKKTKKKKRIPKEIDPKAPLPDPERWLPKRQRKKYRNLYKNKKNYQGASTDNTTTANFGKK